MAKLVPCRNRAGELYGYAHWCPGCRSAHVFHVIAPGPVWTFDGNMEKPTFGPSMRSFLPEKKDAEGKVLRPAWTLCHYFLKEGVIDFLGDSSNHELRGHVPLPEFPEGYQI